jgi:prepilin-type N-terminal cleavage/methylation domain-containing protein
MPRVRNQRYFYAFPHCHPERSGVEGSLCTSARHHAKSACNTRNGFTLVELIVVIVILGILAAIAVPALTAYIAKSDAVRYEQLGSTQLTAMQTFINLELGENGTVPSGASEIFVMKWAIPGGATPAIGYRVEDLTARGKAEYEALTGDTESFLMSGVLTNPRPNEIVLTRAFCTPDGDIKVYYHLDNVGDRFGHSLTIIYVKDINATDPVTTYVLDNSFASRKSELTSGFNVYDDGKKLG